MLDRITKKLKPSGDTAQQTIVSVVWTGTMNVLDRGLQLVMVVVLANLLEPVDFGLMGIALLSLSALKKFSNLGLNAALIQNEDENVDEYLSTAWIFQIGRGILIAIVLFAAAPLIADVFGDQRATDVLRVIALSPVLIGLRNPGVVYFKKHLDFHREFVYRTSGSIAQFCVAVGYGLLVPTVWALVFGFIVADATRLVASYLIHEHRPKLSFDRDHATELFGFGKWITGSSIVVFLYTEGDDAIVGWLLGATPLAFYQNGYRLSNAPATEITQVISNVMFPTFSTLQDSKEQLREAYFRMFQITMTLTCPTAFGIAAVAPTFVETFMGEEWIPMVRAMQILSIYGLMRSIGKTTGPLFKSVGRPDIETKLGFLRMVLIAVLIIPAVDAFGIEGAAGLVVGVSLFPMIPLDIYLLLDTVEASFERFLSELGYPLVASVGMFAAVVELRGQLPVTGVLEFVALVVAGVVTYAAIVGVFMVQFDWTIQQNVQSVVTTFLDG